MSDREALLAAIAANPREETTRLVYADWLDEHGESDVDKATAEYIRGSIGVSVRSQIIDLWAGHMWKRLVPCFARGGFGFVVPELLSGWTYKAIVPRVTAKIGYGRVKTVKAYLYFKCGFLWSYWTASSRVQSIIEPALYVDQPLVGLKHRASILTAPLPAEPQSSSDMPDPASSP
jgi:uncharacterized protein (TIGR02996 family)